MKQDKNTIVVCQDAGGAEVVAAYLSTRITKGDCFYAFGPARKVFRHYGFKVEATLKGKIPFKTIFGKQAKAACVLTGTSRNGSPLEMSFIREAKKRHIPTASYLDHWVNYRERFGYPNPSWKEYLPDEIWVGDMEGYRLAKTLFPVFLVKIKIEPNRYFIRLRLEYAEKNKMAGKRKGIVFMSTPVPYRTEDIIRDLLTLLAVRRFRFPVVVRLHPSEAPTSYNRLISEFRPALRVSLSRNTDILDDINNAALVIGTESMALAVASIL